MSGKTRSRIIGLGTALLVVGVVVALTLGAFGPYGTAAARWLTRGWPIFVILAGIVRLIGFAVDRRPRSPLGAGLLIALGALLLAVSLNGGSGFLQIYGRYWPVLFLVLAGVELIRYYSHRLSEGPNPRLFSPMRLIFIGLIVGTGVLANHLTAADPSLASRLDLSRYFRGIRDSVAGKSFTFTEAIPFITDDVAPGAKIAIVNNRGDVRVIGGASSLRASLIKSVQAWDEDDARQIAERVRLVVEQGPEGFTIRANRDGIDGEINTQIQVEAPSKIALEINNNSGDVESARIDGTLSIDSAHGQIKVRQITGNVSLKAEQGTVDVAEIVGSLSIVGANRVKASQVRGAVTLVANNGTISMSGIGGPVEINAPYSNLTLEDVDQPARIKVEHGGVKISRAVDLAIETSHSRVTAEEVTGSAVFSSSHSRIRVSSLTGALKVVGPHSSVTAKDIQGPVEIETSHGEVSVGGFADAVRVRTSHKDVRLTADSEPVADITVENDHGGIRLDLPSTSLFQLEAYSPRGRIKVGGFEGFTSSVRDRLTQLFGIGGPRITLRTSHRTIMLTGSSDNSRPKELRRAIEGRLKSVVETGT